MPHLDLLSGGSRPKAHPDRLDPRFPGLSTSPSTFRSPDRADPRTQLVVGLVDGPSSSSSKRASWPKGLAVDRDGTC